MQKQMIKTNYLENNHTVRESINLGVWKNWKATSETYWRFELFYESWNPEIYSLHGILFLSQNTENIYIFIDNNLLEPTLKILAPIAYAQHCTLSVCAQLSSETISLNFCLSMRLLLFIVYARSEGSDETAHMRSLVWAYAARRCNKYQNRICWHILIP